MSEGKKVLVVVEELDRVILQEQLITMGLDVDVVVDREKAGSIVTGLTALPTMRDEMMRIIAQREYGGDFRQDAGALADRVAKEFNDFCLHYNFKALRDSVIGKINYSLAQGPDSGGNPALQDSQREASVSINAFDEAHDLMRKTLVEMLHELKGIKVAVTPATLKVDLGAEPLVHMDPRLKEFLLNSGPIGVGGFVDGMKAYINAVTTEEEPVAELNAWLDFVYKHPEVLKRQIQTYECRPVHTKEELIKELSAALTGHGVPQLFPMVLALNLNAKETAEMMRLLNPKVTFNGTHPGTFTPDSIFEVLLSSLREEVPSDVHLCGLSVLRAQERELVIEKLERAIGKHTVKVAGGSKRSFLEGLVNALKEENTFATQITINGAGILGTEELASLTNLFKVGLQDVTEFVDSQSPDEHVLDKLTEIFGGDDCNTIVLHNLKGISGEDKRYIYTSLIKAVEKYQELKRIKKEFLVTGARCLAGNGGDKPVNLTYTLGELAQKWVREAAGYGAQIEPLLLINHLLSQVGVNSDDLAGRILKPDSSTVVHVVNGAGVNIKLGNQTFTRNKDGSLKIHTDAAGKSSTVILNTDGGVMLHGPGYLG